MSDTTYSDEDILELAVRKVRTAEGSKFYGLPIGSPIGPDVIAAKKAQAAAKGVAEPKDALSSASNAKAKSAAAAAPQAPLGAMNVKAWGNQGPVKVKVGNATHGVPAGSKIIRPKGSTGVAYVVTPDGSLHALNGTGEVELPAEIQALLEKTFGPDFQGDDKYDVEMPEVTDEVGTPGSAPDQPELPDLSPQDAPVESLVVGSDGSALFTKTADNEWTNEALGLTVTDDAIQGMKADGGLTITAPPEASQEPALDSDAPYASMSLEEAQAALEALPLGSEMKIQNAPLPLIKSEEGWGTEGATAFLTSNNLAYIRGSIESTTPPKTENKNLDEPKDKAPEKKAPAAEKPKPSADEEDLPDDEDSVEEPDEAPKSSAVDLDDLSDLDEDDADMGEEKDWAGLAKALKPGERLEIPDSEVFSLEPGTLIQTTDNGKTRTYRTTDTGMLEMLLPSGKIAKVDSENIYDLDKVEVIHESDAPFQKKASKSPSKAPSKSPSQPLSKASVVKEKKAEADLEAMKAKVSKAPTVGTTFGASAEVMDALPLGTEVTTSSGSTYTKSSEFSWMSTYGSTYPTDEFVDAGLTLTVSALPTPASAPKVYAKDDKIEKYGHLREMPEGAKIQVSSDITKYTGYTLTKKDGKWQENSGEISTPQDLADDLIMGDLYFVSSPNDSVDTPSESPDVQLVPGEQMLSQAQIHEAVDAMEAHSGFQIAYGYKSIPDHPLAQKPLQDLVKAEASKAYPDLKPKQAFIAYLKDKGGIAPDAPEEKKAAPVSSGAKISFGSKTPESTGVQGMDGGEFTDAEVAEAIAILEAFNGKLFKAELNKKGNALGVLNPNSLVGFDKDKTVVKAKFIALLKEKHAAHQVESSPTPEGVSLQDLKYAAVGQQAVSTDGQTFTKINTILWKNEETGEKWNAGSLFSAFSDGLYIKQAPEKDSTYTQTDAPTLDVLDSAPQGSYIIDSTSGMRFTKDSDGDWASSEAEDTIPYGSGTFAGFDEYTLYSKDTPAPDSDLPDYAQQTEAVSAKVDKPALDEPEAKKQPKTKKSPTLADLESAEPGSYLQDGAGKVYPLSDDGKTWFAADLGIAFTHGSFANNSTYTLHSPEEGAPTPGLKQAFEANLVGSAPPPVDWADASPKDAPLGAVAYETSGHYYVKSESGWEPFDDHHQPKKVPTLSDFTLDMALGHGILSKTPTDGWDKAVDAFDGTKVWSTDGSTYYVKGGPHWVAYNADGSLSDKKKMPNLLVTKGVADGTLAKKQPEVSAAPESSGWSTAKDAPEGTTVWFDDGTYYLVKTGDGWLRYTPDGVQKGGSNKHSVIDKGLKDGYILKTNPNKNLESPNPTGLTPGKYSSPGGKAYMVVSADGDGAYVSGAGNVTPLTADKVKKNYDAGLTEYHGVVDEMPVSKTPAPAPKKKTTGPVTLADGTYYLGASSANATTIYVVKGDNVEIYKGGDVPGYSTVESVPLSKIKTAFFQGKVTDKWGNSILPKDHTGTAYLFGVPSTVPALASLQKALDSGEIQHPGIPSDKQKAALLGAPLNISETLKATQASKTEEEITALGGIYGMNYDTGNPWQAALKDQISGVLGSMLADVDLDVPEADTASYFDWQPGGYATPTPVSEVALGYYSSSTDVKDAVKKVVASIGGGKVLHPPLQKDAAQKWLAEYKKGDFAAMYALEVKAAAAKNKAHPAGYLHPGYEAYPATHKITWGAAVAGEVPAGSTVPGDWSSTPVSDWSMAEIDNYLIKAQMQHPEYLTATQKKTWVANHKQGVDYKSTVDSLSVKAQQYKANGEVPATQPLVWTDNITPSKPYDKVFDESPVPSGDKWQEYPSDVAKAWAADNINDPELQKHLKAQAVEATTAEEILGYYGYKVQGAVQAYWNGKYEAYQIELNTPKYSLVSLIEGPDAGTHDVWITTDQFGKKYVFKPVSKKDLFRAEVEKASADLSAMWGFRTPKHSVVEINGQQGLLQAFADHSTSFKGKNGKALQMSELTEKQVGQVASEHVLDWIIDNDDTHSSNLLLGTDGNVIGIDKGRGFYVYGNWNGLSGDSKANSNANLAYTTLYNDIRSGKVTQEQAHAAYLAAMKAAKRIQNSSDDAAAATVRDGVKNRPNWSAPGYMTKSQTQAPTNADELVAAFLERKSTLVADVDAMWSKIFEASSYDKPEVPAKAINEDHFSGWSEDGFIEAAKSSKSWGVPTLHSGAGVATGTSLVWTEKTTEGTDAHLGTLTVAPLTQKKMVDFFQTKVSTTSGKEPTAIAGFPNLAQWKETASQAGKDATKHLTDKAFTEHKWEALDALDKTVSADLEAWSPDMEADAQGRVLFPSGNLVPQTALYQYRLALEHYAAQIEKSGAARADGFTTTVADYPLFQVQPIAMNKAKYEGPNGAKYLPLSGTTEYLHISEDGDVSKVTLPALVKEEKADGWSRVDQEHSDVDADPIAYSKFEAKGLSGSLQSDGTKVQDNSGVNAGHSGYEYAATLPTGEVIRFRNASSTQTSKSQQGLINFTLAGDDPSSSLVRVQEALSTMGLDFGDATEEDAETIYWRQAFQRVLLSTGHPPKVAAARGKLVAMQSELGIKAGAPGQVDEFSIVEAVALSRTPEEERKFWRDLAVEAYGDEKVNAWISAGKHLPVYNHLDLTDPEKATGKPQWLLMEAEEEIEKMKKAGALLAIGHHGGDENHLKYITSGGMLSTEERLRLLGHFKQGASSAADQGTGGATSIFTRISTPGSGADKAGAIYGSHSAYWSPDALAYTGTYSYGSDQYGNVSHQSSDHKYSPSANVKSHGGAGNETMVQHNLSIFDHLEIMLFDNASKRNEAIQRMKAMGIEKLRGLPIEERLVMREDLNKALQKVRAQWK